MQHIITFQICLDHVNIVFLSTVDDCPQRFNIGSDPYSTELAIYVMGGTAPVTSTAILLLASVLCNTLMVRS